MGRYEQLREELRRRPRTWVVTGVAGFIGSSLLETLLDLGQVVVGLDNFATGYRRNLEEVLRGRPRTGGTFHLHEGDVRSFETCRAVCLGADYVLHQAALASVPRSLEDPVRANEVNVDGTVNLLLAARETGVRRVVYASSCAVYGDCARLPLSVGDSGALLSPYALTKRVAEEYAALFARTHGVDTVGLRYFNVFGPRQDPRGAYAAVVPQWTRSLLEGEPCRIHGDGETTRDFVWVGDVVQANLLAAAAELPPGAHLFNVGGGRRTSLNELHDALASAVRRLRPDLPPVPCVYDDFRAGDIRHSQANISRIQATLGYAPAGDFTASLDVLVAWYEGRYGRPEALARTA
ncbi:MAG TPA: NAD-dependent epimerase/dehydratase family protein [Longimicrobium sp.]|jgi:UDP-N-acetylglucosamine 4-epimerase